MEARLSVVLGTFNRLARLRACIESIFAQTRTPVRVLVSDAGSTDGTVEFLQARASDRLVPVLAGRRVGQARAYNELFDRAETPYVAWLSDDNAVVNRGLDVAVRILDRGAEIGMVALKVQDKTGPFARDPYVGGLSSIGVLTANQGVLRTEILKALGGFCEEYPDYGIDSDLTVRVLLAGHAVVHTRRVALWHYRDWGGRRGSPDFRRRYAKNVQAWKLYARRYAYLEDGGALWRARKAVGLGLRATATILGTVPVDLGLLGLRARDWYNIVGGRYINLLDPFRRWGRDYHLVQARPGSEAAGEPRGPHAPRSA